MPRNTTVTVTAAASRWRVLEQVFMSPPVVAETMGRQVQEFSPLKPETYPVTSSDDGDMKRRCPGRKQSNATKSSTSSGRYRHHHSHQACPRQVDEVTLTR